MKPGTPSLALVEDNVILRNVELVAEVTLIGRSDECDLVLSGREVSRRHCQVVKTGDGFMVEDLGSSNGTFVDRRKVDRQALRHGDRIGVGDFTITFNDGRGLAAAADETEVDTPGEETQTLRARFDKLKEKVREQELVAALDEYQAKTERSRKAHKRRSIHDRLTGVYNRGYFDLELPRLWNEARARQEPLSLLFLDLDHFKRVNDRFGHEKGDETLKAVTRLISKACRKDDVVARYGGEEFVVIFPRMRQDQAGVVAETLRAVIEQKSPSLLGFPQTVSIGVACFPASGPGWEDLLKAADRAVYRAKASGRNRVVKGS